MRHLEVKADYGTRDTSRTVRTKERGPRTNCVQDQQRRPTPSISVGKVLSGRLKRMFGCLSVVTLILLGIGCLASALPAQELTVPAPNEQFIPADQLEAVFNRDRRGVMMTRDEFRKLLETARANAAAHRDPVPILAEQARVFVTPGDQQALVRIELSVRQDADGWQILRIPAGNLLIEKVELDGQPALISRDPAEPATLLLAHEIPGTFSVVLSASTPLVTVGSDRSAAFQLPRIAATSMTVSCPAGRHVLVNDLELDRPAAEEAPADYQVPVGAAADVRLRWVAQRRESEAQRLIFVQTDARLLVQKETVRWESDSRISVFGGAINRVVASVPSRLEVTAVESAGLESWTLDDDPAAAGQTRLTLTYRQPFTNDRLVKIHGVSVSADTSLQRLPTLQFAEVTSHFGRLLVTHEDGLRLMSETGGGVRRVSAGELGLSGDPSVFDFWQQSFELSVAARPRDRELFAESSAVLQIDDTQVTLIALLTIETLNAPLFELPLTLPADWQLQTVTSGDQPIPWTASGDPAAIVVRPIQPVAAGQLLPLSLTLTRTIADPDIEQKLPLPVVTTEGTTTVGGIWTVRFADDLIVAPLSLSGLNPVSGTGTELVFQNPGTPVSGELSIARKQSQLAGRSVLRTWADSRQQSLDAEIIIDVLSGTVRTLTVRLSEALGPDVRFVVRNVGPVPGLVQTRAILPVTIIEQSAGTPANGLRPFVLKLDHRFAGSLSLQAFVQLPRTESAPIPAPIVQIQDAVRQHGVLVFEASPEQQLKVGPEVAQIPGLFVADAGLVDPPPVATGRRVALMYRFVQPDYTFTVAETRFATNAVPSAVCVLMANICTLNDAGGCQRWTQAKVRSSGIQTLRFTLPDPERSFLWSTMLNGQPVEVRRDEGDYLVAVPADLENGEFLLTVLFETADDRRSAFGRTEQRPLQLSIDAGKLHAIPIDVLQQQWRVHYPQTSLLVDSDGQFRPVQGLDRPGWLVTLGQISWPDSDRLTQRVIGMGIFFLILFVLCVLIQRRRWKSLVLMVAGCVICAMFLPTVFLDQRHAGSMPFTESFRQLSAMSAARESARSSVESAPAPMAAGEGGFSDEFLVPMAEESVAQFDAPAAPPAGAMGGMAGSGGAGLGGGMEGAAMPGLVVANEPQAAISGPESDRRTEELASPALGFQAQQFGRTNGVQSLEDATSSTQLGMELPAAPQDAAKPRRGSARLSVNVNLDVPDGYRSREFTSVADAVHQPSVLSVVVQKQSQITAIRFVAMLLVLLLGWTIRKSGLLWKLTIACCAAIAAAAMLPLVDNAWQSVLDGIVLGAIIFAVLAIASAVVRGCRTVCRPSRLLVRSSSAGPAVAGVILTALVTTGSDAVPASGQETIRQEISQPDLVVPYVAGQPALESNRVFIRHDDFLKLYQQAYPDTLTAPATGPLGSTVVATYLRTGALTPVDGTKHTLSVESRFVVWCDSDRSVSIPLPLGPVAIRSVKVDGQNGTVQPLVIGVAGADMPNFAAQIIPQQQQQQEQQVVPANAAPLVVEGPAYAVQLSGKGPHVVDLQFDLAATVEGELGRTDLPLRNPAAGMLEWILPGDGLDAKVNGRTSVYRRDGRTVLVPVAQMSTLRLQWLPTIQKAAGDVVFHSSVRSAMSLQDSGITLRTTVEVTCRQGEISELSVTIPDNYSVQSVTGDDLAGWDVRSTDNTRSVQMQLRRSVADATKLTLQLYAATPSTEALASLPIPISMVRGAGRDLGTVTLKTGPQFQVRSDSLSGVSQVNPGEAPMPDGDELPGRPMLAWRYTRHPAAVVVKVNPVVDELTTVSMHAMRLEEQRQLWTSRLDLNISGAPRARIDVSVPKTFLVLDVSAPGLKDWYFSDDEPENGATRTLSIQLQDAVTGNLKVAVHGQMNRDADRSLLTLAPPVVLHARSARSELAVWLDAASESAGLENPGDWTVKPVTAADACFREITPSTPSLVFQSPAAQPGALQVKLRPAVSTLIGESVTVTNVTETAVDLLLALNWQVARAAADQFAVELPTVMASVMTFDVPGQRQVQKEDLGNGRTRVTFRLQQPVTDRLFILGTASLPLPADRVIRTDVPEITVPAGAPSVLSGQSHFWVLVNQSSGLLQPTSDQPDLKVTVDQITTQIPPQLVQQAVAVARLRPDTAAWNLVYPDAFQVSPAVVTLATHTTVIADDGSWRSRHQLQVTNESRQFLPVRLPVGSRLIACRVQGRPSRVVIQSDGDRELHLIPIPQSGTLGAGFEVEFTLTGRFDDSAAMIRKRWSSETLMIPVPVFPEFRDEPEFGISVSRNRWTVFVPETWRAVPVDDPAATNVVKAGQEAMEDASLLSYVEQASTLLKSAGAARGAYLKGRALSLSTQVEEALKKSVGNDASVEQQRGDVLGRLSDLSVRLRSDSESGVQPQIAGQDPNRPVILGNFFLGEQDFNQNSLNKDNNDDFSRFNRPTTSAGQSERGGEFESPGGTPAASDTDGGNLFRFGLSGVNDAMDAFQEKAESIPADRMEIEARDLKEERKKVQDLSKSDGLKSGRSSLMQRQRRSLESAGKQLADKESGIEELIGAVQAPAEALDAGLQLQNADPSQMRAGGAMSAAPQENSGAVQQLPELLQSAAGDTAGLAATPTGLLSLQFEIPTDGQRIDFLRVGGNPQLSLVVRSSEAVSRGTGLVWAALCVAGIAIIARPGSRGQPLVFAQRLCLLLAVAGFSAWLLTTGPISTLALPVCVAASLGFAVTCIVREFGARATA